ATAGTINLSTAPAAAAGKYDVTLIGTDGAVDATERSLQLEVTVASGIPAAATLTAPANGATGVGTLPAFTWTGSATAVTYTIDVARYGAFSSVAAPATIDEATWTPSAVRVPMT